MYSSGTTGCLPVRVRNRRSLGWDNRVWSDVSWVDPSGRGLGWVPLRVRSVCAYALAREQARLSRHGVVLHRPPWRTGGDIRRMADIQRLGGVLGYAVPDQFKAHGDGWRAAARGYVRPIYVVSATGGPATGASPHIHDPEIRSFLHCGTA